uniref:Pseudouridine-5'-monophosphatase n=1 Tax=Steinernema glaseri TaxID=37863 RepID=A0A1I7ZTK2_9BILA
MMGRKREDALKILLKYHGMENTVTVDEFGGIAEAILYELLPKAAMLPGAMELVEHFHRNSIPMAICTGSAAEDFMYKTKSHQRMLDLIPIRTLTGDDPEVKRGKPAPDGYLVTMKKFAVIPTSPSNVLVFEDAANGVESGLAAGMRVCAVPTPGVPFPEETRSRADVVLNSLEEFDPTMFGLPPMSQ